MAILYHKQKAPVSTFEQEQSSIPSISMQAKMRKSPESQVFKIDSVTRD